MAKQLLVIRHAKSDWGNSALSDFDRPLNKRGKANAPEMANRMVKHGIIPDLVVSSPAVRAITTAKFFAGAWGISAEAIMQEPTIYEASTRSLLAVINKLNNKYDRVACFGHNPGLTDLINYLDGPIDNLPTCGVILFEFPYDDWQMISAHSGKVLLYDYPKNSDD